MSPKGMTASTSIAMPTSRVSAVSIMVSTTNPAAMSRIPLGRSQARVSASDAGGFRPNVPEIKAAFEQGLKDILSATGGNRNEAIFQTAALIGGIVLARAVGDPGFSDEILRSVRQKLG